MLAIILKSITQPASYRKLAELPLWRIITAILLFFILTALVSGASLYRSSTSIVHQLDRVLPELRFDGTTLHVDQTEPTVLFDAQGVMIALDTVTDSPISLLSNQQTGFVFTKDTLLIKDQAMVQKFPYTDIGLPSFNRSDLLQTFKNTFFTFIVIWKALGVIFKMLAIFLFSLIGILFANMQKVRLPYSTIWKLTALALIPAYLVNTINDFILSGWLTLAFWVAIAAYLYSGIQLYKEPVAK